MTLDAVRAPLLAVLRERLPDVLGIWAFGSRVTGGARADSDLDLAVLVPGYADPLLLFSLAADLAEVAGCDVDVLDLRAASTVMQAQVVAAGACWFSVGDAAERYEWFVQRAKWELDAARAGILADVAERGSVYGQ